MRSNLPRAGRALALMGLALAAGCAGIPRTNSTYSGTDQPTALSVAFVFGPVRGDGRDELQQLDQQPSTPANELRRAVILLETGSADRALQVVRGVLFGRNPPTPATESFGYMVRARVHDIKGDAKTARYDRERAVRLALDEELRQLALAGLPAAQDPRARPSGEATLADLPVLPRTAWAPNPTRPQRLERMAPVFRITVHHSALLASDSSQRAAAAAIARIQREHMDRPEWGDIGYHYLIDRAGRIWAGRSLAWQGAHAGDPEKNRGNIGICLLGNFVRGREGQEPTGPQTEALRGLIAALRTQYAIRSDQILTHQELKPTECPGERLQTFVDRLRREGGGIAAGQ